MPRASDGRPAVGTIHCDGCNETATLFQVRRGGKKGYLYKRCGCGADQRTGKHIQREWLRGMTPRDIGDEWIEHPLDLGAPEPDPAPVGTTEPDPAPVGTDEPAQTSIGTDEPTGNTTNQPRGGLVALAIVAGSAALALIAN